MTYAAAYIDSIRIIVKVFLTRLRRQVVIRPAYRIGRFRYLTVTALKLEITLQVRICSSGVPPAGRPELDTYSQ